MASTKQEEEQQQRKDGLVAKNQLWVRRKLSTASTNDDGHLDFTMLKQF